MDLTVRNGLEADICCAECKLQQPTTYLIGLTIDDTSHKPLSPPNKNAAPIRSGVFF